MHVEYRNALKRSLSVLGNSLTLPPDLEFEVTECKFPEYGLLTTNLAFVAAQSLPSVNPVGLTPITFGELLVTQLVSDSKFDCHIGGQGYINASPTAELVRDYFEFALRKGPQFFFSKCSCYDVTAVNQEILPIEVDWSSRFAKNSLERNDEVRFFLESLRGKEPIKREEQLMLLGLMADEELEAAPYLHGLCGSQNVPWYIERFIADASSFTAELERSIDRREEGPCTFDFSRSAESLTVIASGLLTFRGRYWEARNYRRADLVLASLLRLIKAFYHHYNWPQVRMLSSAGVNPDEQKRVFCLSSLTLGLVKKGLELLKFPQELAGTAAFDSISG